MNKCVVPWKLGPKEELQNEVGYYEVADTHLVMYILLLH